MATRTTVYLSHELAVALGPYKDRLNLSRMLADALQREIRMLQLRDKSLQDDDHEAVLERLRLERQASRADDETAGQRVAARDVKTLSYLELESIADIDLAEPPDPEAYAWGNEYLRGPYSHLLPEGIADDFINTLSHPQEHVDPDAWARGWLSYVQAWWRHVREQL